jgi:hypothetical protein
MRCAVWGLVAVVAVWACGRSGLSAVGSGAGEDSTGSSSSSGGVSSSSGGVSGNSSGGVSGNSSGGVSNSSSGGVSGNSSGSSSGGEPIDATPLVVCTLNPGSSAGTGDGTDGSPPPCQTSVSETCSDGNTYYVTCQCPSATCACFMTSATGGSGSSVVTYPGCPSCTPASWLFSLCGYPQ